MLFLKLGGSLLTDKTGVEAVRNEVLARLAADLREVLEACPSMRLLIGHGAGSFGHVVAARYQTRRGVRTAGEWRGFAEVHASMIRLNRLVTEVLLEAGVPAFSFPPSALAQCADGRITALRTEPILAALNAGLAPVVYGDVAFDAVRGGTIISTEMVLAALARDLRPSWLLLAGETAGVYDQNGAVIPVISPDNFAAVRAALGGSRGTDVTGGMAGKVQEMLALVAEAPALAIRIFSGLEAGLLKEVLLAPETAVGTRISS